MQNINDTLLYMVRMLDKMKQELHELQHLTISREDYEKLEQSAKQLTQYAFNLHLLNDDWSQKYQAELPELDLKAIRNNDLIQKLRHFRGYEKQE